MKFALIRIIVASSIILTLTDFTVGQDIQWASSIDFKFNYYEKNKFSAGSILGAPNAKPYGELNEDAFRLKTEASFGTIVVNYSKPQKVRYVVIVENHLPGKITSVILHNDNGSRYQIYKKEAFRFSKPFRTLLINVPENDYVVSKVEVNVDTQIHSGWSQIDAIGITDNSDVQSLKKRLNRYLLTNFHEEMSYGDEKENIGAKINTKFNETRPVLSPDGKTLYFCRQNYPENTKGESDPQDIYYSTLIDNDWSTPQNIGTPLNDVFANGVNSVSPDGNSMLLINQYSDFAPVRNGVSLTYKTSEGWSFPERLNITNYYNNNEFADFFLSSDGKALILAVERDDSNGDQDLYVCLDQWGNKWSEPINLGKVINTDKAEFSPFLAADGKTLYFASEGHNGYGGSDIYCSMRLDDTWLNWSSPKNLGSMVNSVSWDAYYSASADGKQAYFVSTKGSSGNSKDIYKISLPKEIKPEPILVVSGKLLEEGSNKPVSAEIQIISSENEAEIIKSFTNPNTGEYMTTLPAGKNYFITTRSKGYLTKSDTLEGAKFNKYAEIRKNISVVPIVVGETIIMKNINFAQGEATLLEASYPEIERLIKFLNDNPGLEIELGGHTDRTGSQKLNLELSERRVKVVKTYLEKKGIDGKRLKVKAYGASAPVASNASEKTRKLNRRVEIKILKYSS